MELTSLTKDCLISIDNEIFVVKEFQITGENAQVELINYVSRDKVKRTISVEDNVEIVEIEHKEMQFSYQDGNLYYFMDIENYQQLPLSYDMVKNIMNYVVEDSIVTMHFIKDKLIGISPKEVVELVVAELGEDVKAGYKNAKLETGYELKVPEYILLGDKIKVNSETGEFVEVV